jgi:hypothetical protein
MSDFRVKTLSDLQGSCYCMHAKDKYLTGVPQQQTIDCDASQSEYGMCEASDAVVMPV